MSLITVDQVKIDAAYLAWKDYEGAGEEIHEQVERRHEIGDPAKTVR